jgi:DNA primase
MIDIISLLESKNIDYSTSGKNTSRGWVELNCPFCGNDPSFHLGVNLSSGIFHCWICGAKGGIEKLIQKLLGIPRREAEKIISTHNINFLEQEIETKNAKNIVFPKGLEDGIPSIHRNFLRERGFSPNEVIQKYKLKAYHHLGGKWSFRIVIPVLINNQMVSFIARDVTNKQTPKYKNLSNEQSIINIKNCLYNIDSVKKGGKVIIVEGVFDQWRVGDGSCALLGTEYTTQQLFLLYQKKLKKAYVMLDADATKKANKLGHMLSTFIPSVEVIEIDKGDPADMSQDEINQFRKDIEI